jgi:hypothetical protein
VTRILNAVPSVVAVSCAVASFHRPGCLNRGMCHER